MDPLWISLAGMAIPIIIVPTVLVLRQKTRDREMEHRERMKALETGQPMPTRTAWPAALVCTAIGFGVPSAAFLFTWLASVTANLDSEIWFAPAVVSILSVATAGKLATKLMRPVQPAVPEPLGKPSFDPDSYDVASSRG